MRNDRIPGSEREEAPFVSALLLGGFSRIQNIIRQTIVSLNSGTRLLLWAAGTVLTFVGILLSGIAESPGIGGLLKGIFGGLLMALVFAGTVGWLFLWAVGSRSRDRHENADAASRLDTLLAPTLRELNAVRADVIAKVKARSVTRVPLGTAGGFVVWVFSLWTNDPPGVLGLLAWVVGGALAGEAWAAGKLEREYTRLYKQRVLPLLAARFGDLTYRQASRDDVLKLRGHRILPEFDRMKADDEIVGTHRGLRIEIVEVRLERRSGDDTHVVFDGLMIELTLPRSLTGTTVVLTDEGVFGNLKARWRSDALAPVRLEDARFEQRYEVYSTDQVEARALLTPAFMERFMALATGSGFSLPGALAEGNRLALALPKGLKVWRDLFEPPEYWKPAGGQALVKLEEDIRAVLDMADAVIDLDFWAAGRKRDSMRA
jgi:hypothetical protein